MLASRNEERYVIPIRNSFSTVRELHRRGARMDSILNSSGFLLVDEPKTLGMPSREVLERFKVGLRDALYMTDRLADFATEPSLYASLTQSEESEPRRSPPHADAGGGDNYDDDSMPFASDDAEVSAYNAQLAQHLRQMHHLRDLQIAHIRSLPTRDLAWLLTLGMGASRGYRRYSWELLKHDPGMGAARSMAFKEVLFRSGVFFLWGFMRGTGSLAGFIRAMIWQVAEEVIFFEEGVEIEGERMPDGLHMTALGELGRRVVEARKREAAEEGSVFDEEAFTTTSQPLWEEVNHIVGREIGWTDWRGYEAVQHPVDEDE